MIVPQYEGQPLLTGQTLLKLLDDLVPAVDSPARQSLELALREIALI